MYPPLIRQPDGHSILGSHYLHHLLLATVTLFHQLGWCIVSYEYNQTIKYKSFCDVRGVKVIACLFVVSVYRCCPVVGRGPVQPPMSRSAFSCAAFGCGAARPRAPSAPMRLSTTMRAQVGLGSPGRVLPAFNFGPDGTVIVF